MSEENKNSEEGTHAHSEGCCGSKHPHSTPHHQPQADNDACCEGKPQEECCGARPQGECCGMKTEQGSSCEMDNKPTEDTHHQENITGQGRSSNLRGRWKKAGVKEEGGKGETGPQLGEINEETLRETLAQESAAPTRAPRQPRQPRASRPEAPRGGKSEATATLIPDASDVEIYEPGAARQHREGRDNRSQRPRRDFGSEGPRRDFGSEGRPQRPARGQEGAERFGAPGSAQVSAKSATSAKKGIVARFAGFLGGLFTGKSAAANQSSTRRDPLAGKRVQEGGRPTGGYDRGSRSEGDHPEGRRRGSRGGRGRGGRGRGGNRE